MTTPLWQYTMAGQRTLAPYQSVYWTVYNAPDTTGQYSGYFGQLQNIEVVAQQQVSFPSNATPTIDANSLNGTPIANTAPANGQVLVFDSTSNTYVPGGTTGGGGQTNVTLVNGLNSNINTGGLSTVVAGGPTGPFSIGGLTSGSAGRILPFRNTTSQPMTILNEDPSSLAANRFFIPNGAAITLQPQSGTVFFAYDSVSTRWVLQNVGIHRPTVYNVKDYGAVGDGVTNDTAAIVAAAAIFQAAMLANGYPSYGSAGYSLYFPAGNYLVHSPITITGITGGCILGDGIGASVVLGANSAQTPQTLTGARGVLILENCSHTTVRDMQVLPGTISTRFTGCAAAATSITVTSASQLSVGQRVALMRVDASIAEMVSIAAISGTSVTLAKGTLYSYSNNDYVVCGPLGSITCYSSYTGTQNISHACKFERVQFNGTSGVASLFGFATDCRGGAPVNTVGSASSGQPTITVDDATQIIDGATYTLWTGIATPLDTLIVSSHSPSLGTIAFTTNLTHTYGAGTYVVSKSDANNDEHVFKHCATANASVASIGLNGWNSLNHVVSDSEAGSSYAIVSSRKGGSIKWIGGDASGYSATFEFGGGQQQPQILQNSASEGSSAQLLVAHSADNCQGLTVWADHLNVKSHPATGNLIDVTGTLLSLSFNACSIVPGLGAGNSVAMSFVDTSGAGTVIFKGGCVIGADVVIANGTQVIDVDSTWTSTAVSGQAPTETCTNGGGVRTVAAVYGYRNQGDTGNVERRPSSSLVLVNGNNDGLAISGDADIIATGPTGAYAVKGFAVANKGQRLRIKFNVNQQLTIKNNSSANVPILTPTGADVVFGAPGAFNIIDFWCDGTNWNLV